MSERHGIVVVGGSYAAVQVAASARKAGYQEPIRILSEEEVVPYQRPPLSKAFLTEERNAAMPLRAEAFYREQGIALELGVRVTSVDRSAKCVLGAQGTRFHYDRMVLATGSRPRVLRVDGHDLCGVHYLRSISDAVAIKSRLQTARNVVVIGGGFIGLEVAASAAALGRQVAVIEAMPHLMSRALPALLADWFAAVHRRHAVQLHLGTAVAALRGNDDQVCAVKLLDGTEIEADLVIVGIGVVPNEELASSAGLPCANGVVVNTACQTCDSDIFAIGDCARYPSRFSTQPVRLESVQNAIDQGRAVGTTLSGRMTVYDSVPWFWSDQFDVKLQITGLAAGHEEYAIRGSLEEGKFSIFYLRQGRLVGVDSVNRPAEHMLGRKLVTAGVPLSKTQIADSAFELKALVT